MPRSTSLHRDCQHHLAQLFFQPEILQVSEVPHQFSFTSDKSTGFGSCAFEQTSKEKKLGRLERIRLYQAPENQSMVLFKNCLFEIIDDNTSVKNVINILQTISICLVYSCLVDVYRSQIRHRRIICWLAYFWFIPFYLLNLLVYTFSKQKDKTSILQGGNFPPVASRRESF